jgi:hypothetical protein
MVGSNTSPDLVLIVDFTLSLPYKVIITDYSGLYNRPQLLQLRSVHRKTVFLLLQCGHIFFLSNRLSSRLCEICAALFFRR